MIERYRQANGALPDSPCEVVPSYATSLPTDPFNSQDLRHLHDTDSYVVYSVGADGVNNKGNVVVAEDCEDPRDIGLRIRPSTVP